MIFVTVGTDLPFDRMVRVIDHWASEMKRSDVFAQIGNNGWEPSYIEFVNMLEPPEFIDRFKSASVVVSHAGMGTILSALHFGKPILVVPKLAKLGEHRNDHQLATARRMEALGNVNVAYDEKELRRWLNRLDDVIRPTRIGEAASRSLTRGLRDFIFQD